MSSRNVKSGWYQLRMRLLGKDPSENYLFAYHNHSTGERDQYLVEDGGNVSAVHPNAVQALQRRGLLKQVAHVSTVQPDTDSYHYEVL